MGNALLNGASEVDISGHALTEVPFLQNDVLLHKDILKLYLRHNRLENLPQEISQLTRLTEISLRENLFTDFPLVLCYLKTLTKLSLSFNRIREVPKEIRFLKQLQLLSLQGNRIEELPNEIGELSQLQGLDLSRNRIHSLPETFGHLKSLETLLLQDNQLKTISDSFGQLKSLKAVNFTRNQLNSVSESLGTLNNLEELILSKNNLTALPQNFFLKLKNLHTFEIHTNQMTEIPKDIQYCTKLRRLNFAINKVTQIPKEVAHLSQLEWFNLNDNALESLPEIIGVFTNLNKLGLVKNKLKVLPNEIGLLKSLIKLDVRNNQLHFFPPTIKFLPKLTSLVHSENPWETKRGLLNSAPNLKELCARQLWNHASHLISQANFNPEADIFLESQNDEEKVAENNDDFLTELGVSHLTAMNYNRPNLCHLCLSPYFNEYLEYINDSNLMAAPYSKLQILYRFCSFHCMNNFKEKGFCEPKSVHYSTKMIKFHTSKFSFLKEEKRKVALEKAFNFTPPFSPIPVFNRNTEQTMTEEMRLAQENRVLFKPQAGYAFYKLLNEEFKERHENYFNNMPARWLLSQMRHATTNRSDDSLDLELF